MKHLRIAVCPPDGTVKVSAPRYVTNTEIQTFILERLAWIREQRDWFLAQPQRESPSFHSGETVLLWGKKHILKCRDSWPQEYGRSKIFLEGEIVYLNFAEHACSTKKEHALTQWYRKLLKEKIPTLIQRWQEPMGVVVNQWGVKKMKTRWGSCNINDARIWLNLALIHYPSECIEYVVVHEMAHLLEANHSAKFWAIVAKTLPDWKKSSSLLN